MYDYDDLTQRQKDLIDYLMQGVPKAQAYAKAYPKSHVKNKTDQVNKMINNKDNNFPKFSVVYQKMLEESKKRLEKEKEESILSATDVLKFLSDVIRNEEKDVQIVPQGRGKSKIQETNASVRDKIRAAELLGRANAMFTDKNEITANASVQILDDIPKDDD